MNDPIDKVLEIGGMFDWITPAIALIRSGHTFTLQSGHVWDARQTLKRGGISSWGGAIHGDTGLLNVSHADAARAQQVLQGDGIEILGGEVAAPAAGRQRGNWINPEQPRRGRWIGGANRCEHCQTILVRDNSGKCKNCGAAN